MAAGLTSLDNDHIGALRGSGEGIGDRGHHGDDLGPVLVEPLRELGLRDTETGREDRDSLLEHHLDGRSDQIGGCRRAIELRRQVMSGPVVVEHTLHTPDEIVVESTDVDGRADVGMQPDVDPEGPIGQFAHLLDPGPQRFGSQVERRENAESAGVADRGHELGARHATHPRLEDGMGDTEEPAERRVGDRHASSLGSRPC